MGKMWLRLLLYWLQPIPYYMIDICDTFGKDVRKNLTMKDPVYCNKISWFQAVPVHQNMTQINKIIKNIFFSEISM